MEGILGIIILCLAFLSYFQWNRNKTLKKEINYVSEKVEKIIQNKEQGVVLIVSESKEIQRITCDINEFLYLYYQKQTECNQMKESMQQMVTNISHDLRTPITVLKGYMEMLMLRSQELNLQEQAKTIIQKVNTKTEGLVQSIDDIFALAKLESKDMLLEKEEIDINKLCKEVMLEYYDILVEKEVEVAIEVEHKPLLAVTNQKALKRILKNLIDNGIKYGEEGHFLGIKTWETEILVGIEIEDHGQGIKEENIQKVFERKFKVNHHQNGNGLGLAIVKGLVNELGGHIQVTSEPNKKTIFTVTLPKS